MCMKTVHELDHFFEISVDISSLCCMVHGLKLGIRLAVRFFANYSIRGRKIKVKFKGDSVEEVHKGKKLLVMIFNVFFCLMCV